MTQPPCAGARQIYAMAMNTHLEDDAGNGGAGLGEARALHALLLEQGIPLDEVEVEPTRAAHPAPCSATRCAEDLSKIPDQARGTVSIRRPAGRAQPRPLAGSITPELGSSRPVPRRCHVAMSLTRFPNNCQGQRCGELIWTLFWTGIGPWPWGPPCAMICGSPGGTRLPLLG